MLSLAWKNLAHDTILIDILNYYLIVETLIGNCSSHEVRGNLSRRLDAYYVGN